MTAATLELDSSEIGGLLDRLTREDVVGQLFERRRRMGELGSGGGEVKVDWVDQVGWGVDYPDAMDGVETLAKSIRSRFAHVIWSGMGGSIQAVHTLEGMGLLGSDGLSLHPLDSTDPAALNRLLRELGSDGDLGAALERTLMVGVSMGMTSEEPITHLRWFEDLLRAHGDEHAAEHVMVMTLPGSFLDQFAHERGAPRVDIQLDGDSHTPGRMSAPSTRVFLLPAALGLPGRLHEIMRRLNAETTLRPGTLDDEPFVRLAAWLSVQIDEGRDMLVLDLPPRWAPLAPWVEQVVEESLCKDGRGLLVFYEQDLPSASAWPDRFCILRVDEGSGAELPNRPCAVLRIDSSDDTVSRLTACARCFAGWNLTVALVGYLQEITFAGQPAVEHYKSYARRLRDAEGSLPYPDRDFAITDSRPLQLFAPTTHIDVADVRRPTASALPPT